MNRAQENTSVTVTGTSGIGKSVFYAYFASRYSHDFQDATIIAAAFAPVGVRYHIKDAVVWKAGKLVCRAQGNKYKFMDRVKQEATGKVIHLYDGTPIKPPVGADMVCFTRPDMRWLEEVALSHSHRLVMPLWSEGELQRATDCLDPMDVPPPATNADKNEDPDWVSGLILQRHHIFGGVAREYLSTDETFVEERELELQQQILAGVDPVKRMYLMTGEELAYHPSFHWKPNLTDPSKFSIESASTFVGRVLGKELWKFCKDGQIDPAAILNQATILNAGL